MRISPKGFVFSAAALFTILSAIIGVIYFCGVWTSLKFDWMQPAIPYLHAFIACAVLLWLAAFVVDYSAIRRAALAKPLTNSTDYSALIETEKQQRAQAIADIYKHVNSHVNQADLKFNELFTPKTEPSLKQRTEKLTNDLFAFLHKLGPEPPHPLSNKSTVEEQREIFDAYFKWKKQGYFNYMAYFKDRVVTIDYELAANGILTKLEVREIDPSHENQEVDLVKIAETLLLVSKQIH